MNKKKCLFCEEIGKEKEGVWEIIIFRKFRGIYEKQIKPICHDCLANALIGFHTGGGLVGNVIKKIKRVNKEVEKN